MKFVYITFKLFICINLIHLSLSYCIITTYQVMDLFHDSLDYQFCLFALNKVQNNCKEVGYIPSIISIAWLVFSLTSEVELFPVGVTGLESETTFSNSSQKGGRG